MCTCVCVCICTYIDREGERIHWHIYIQTHASELTDIYANNNIFSITLEVLFSLAIFFRLMLSITIYYFDVFHDFRKRKELLIIFLERIMTRGTHIHNGAFQQSRLSFWTFPTFSHIPILSNLQLAWEIRTKSNRHSSSNIWEWQDRGKRQRSTWQIPQRWRILGCHNIYGRGERKLVT